MMGEFMKILLSLSFSGACLFLFVFMTVRLCRNRLGRRWQYYIWLLVVLRFLIPVTFPNTLAGRLFQRVEPAATEGNAADGRTGEERADVVEREGKREDAADGAADEERRNDAADGIENTEGQGPEKAG